MADTYVDALTVIADESRRPLASYRTQIAQCFTDAIALSERETYWFNDGNSQTFATVADQEEYTLTDNSIIPYITEFEDLTIAISSSDKRRLTKASWDRLQELNRDGLTTGQPTYYAYAFKKIRLYPIPNDVWTVTMAVNFTLDALTDDSEQNCWTIVREGGLLVRYRAQELFYGTYLRLPDRAAQFHAMAEAERDRLVASTSRRQATGRIRRSL